MPKHLCSPHHVLVLNCGSSSLKFAILDATTSDEVISGLAERLGSDTPSIKYKYNGEKQLIELAKGQAHDAAINKLVYLVKNLGLEDKLVAVGHRVVHGGEHFTESVLIDNDVLIEIEKTAALAPLHNPANLLGIRTAQQAFSTLPQIAVFDTAFHQTMPKIAYLYALPYSLYKEHGVRRYGFHGTSHYYVAGEAAKLLGKERQQTNVISAHLGNGCSVCAIKDGKSVDTSMGLTPLEGLVMGTRSGSIDPGLFTFLTQQLNYSVQEIDDLLNKQSGLLGISELSNDCRTIEEAAVEGHPQANLALDIFCYRLAKQIAAFLVPLQRLDALIFTGGIGENSDIIRDKVISHLGFLGLECDEAANLAARFGKEGLISKGQAHVKAFVIPTNEEWVIANDAARIAKEA
ncbi:MULTISPECIES: acetate kinase [unclassified Pseudoalteromonas]|uniref:acetate kinase n=1 Tax=unclassified Pseudoalteromonas TaxID=194690 RepID=UPI000C94D90B|nr:MULTISPECIES: acetate kinase [unclassified Pseudoalteromonas]QWV05700.1 acetate kinase [Pseudoalteromonas shioyasakiensis]MAD02858.1 acetate kinase [Pseudoalteromonas sp.]MCG9710351.1 acetate kinase [Pseudoalteromonas sp. Isolate3]MCP4586298.1 acetate kinase [Pseudoalteromonas sp.]NIZ06500.1 acetate kinase [Pseudoalteromonas sp. HF66]|tara:strand:- start:1952 stop:3166 length:1215 start_codon:yes stop_codon:yes gene_type:complete